MYLLRNTPEVDPGIEKKQLEKDNYHESVSTLYDESKKDLKEAEDPRTAVENESRQDQDSNTIWWDSDDDPENPMNWSSANKWANLGIISIITFIIPLASSMLAPGVEQVVAEFHVTNDLLGSLVVSTYVLGLAFGPLILAPLSEVYGRKIIYSISNVLYVIFTIACAVSSSMSMLIVWRFLAGCVGSAPMSIGGGTIADMFPLQQRGRALSIYILGSVSGPAVGPIMGGFLTQYKGWRWIFWLLAIMAGAVGIVQIIFLKESYAVTILSRKTRRLQKETSNINSDQD